MSFSYIVSLLVLITVVSAQTNRTVLIGPGFWNVRATFIIDGLNIGTQMSLIQLPNQNFLIVDTVELDPDLLNDINMLTKNGTLIEAVIATHPFHTTYFPSFYQQFPKPPYFGTPRHLRIEPQIPWAGTVWDCAVREKWLPDVHMRIPYGSEFVAPEPESSNHFSGMHVFHPASKTIHVDDTIMIDEPLDGDMLFHPSMLVDGLYHIPESPYAFRDWITNITVQWDFDNICAAHNGVKLGGAKQQLINVISDYGTIFEGLMIEYELSPNATQEMEYQDFLKHESMCNQNN
jgi:hypothetical protein